MSDTPGCYCGSSLRPGHIHTRTHALTAAAATIVHEGKAVFAGTLE